MKLLIALITYNRLSYTKRTLEELWDKTSDSADYFLVVIDNASTDGSTEYLKGLAKRGRINELILNETNYYPGKACNIGWEQALNIYSPTHLMRLDNDMQLTKDWDLRAADYFKAIPELGQLGIEHEAIETPQSEEHRRTINGMEINEWPGVVGGPMIMPKKLWDKGIRYDESPWFAENPQIPVMQEDSKLSARIKNMGYAVGHSQEELGRTFATRDTWKEYPEYYKETMLKRGYKDLIGDLDA
jgi:glycosyltransferase involved in cell wall biosynthesis